MNLVCGILLMCASTTPVGADAAHRSAVLETAEASRGPSVPAVVPRQVTGGEIDLPAQIRIRIVSEEKEVRIVGAAELRLETSAGSQVVPAHLPIRFQILSGQPGHDDFSVITREFARCEKTVADREFALWKSRGYPVEMLQAGGIFRKNGAVVTDNIHYWIGVGSFPTAKEAEGRQKEVREKFDVPAFILEVRTLAPTGSYDIYAGEGEGKLLVKAATGLSALSSDNPILVKNVLYGKGFPWVGREDRTYRGTLRVGVDNTGQLKVINALPVEDYLLGVISSEIGEDGPPEALKVQAVCARGESLAKFKVRHLEDLDCDLCAEQHCQVYAGRKKEYPSTSKAVDDTLGEVLTYQEGSFRELVDSVYHGICGGMTENGENVWTTNPRPYFRGIEDYEPGQVSFTLPLKEAELRSYVTTPVKSYCAYRHPKRFRWVKVFSQKEIDDLVAKTYPDLGSVKKIELLERGVSGRLKHIRIHGEKKIADVYKEYYIRKVFGMLNSGCFILDLGENPGGVRTYTFTGAGWGHGVGMCQEGARGMAEAGKKYPEILGRYFKGTRVERIY